MGMVHETQLSFVGGLDFWRPAPDHQGSSKGRIRHDLQCVIFAIAKDQGVQAEQIRRPHGRYLQRLRMAAIYLTSVHFDWPICTLANLLGLSRMAGSKVGKVIEDRRDDVEFDQWLDDISDKLGNIEVLIDG